MSTKMTPKQHATAMKAIKYLAKLGLTPQQVMAAHIWDCCAYDARCMAEEIDTEEEEFTPASVFDAAWRKSNEGQQALASEIVSLLVD